MSLDDRCYNHRVEVWRQGSLTASLSLQHHNRPKRLAFVFMSHFNNEGHERLEDCQEIKASEGGSVSKRLTCHPRLHRPVVNAVPVVILRRSGVLRLYSSSNSSIEFYKATL